MSTPQPPSPGSIRCPRCDAILGPEQDWCLNCGAPARTRLAPRPNWKAPVAVVATIAVLSGIALAVAFVSLTGDDDSPTASTTPTTTTAVATTPVTPPAVTTPPTTTAPAVTLPTVPTTTPTTTPATTTTTPASTFTVTTPTITAPTTTSP
ncbi:MAG TPA: hypothetical protein VFZ89_07015 [Solirubrobacteraceae bacterium]